MRRLLIVSLVLLVFVSLAASVAQASRVHFTQIDSWADEVGNAVVDFEINGLGDREITTVTARSDAVALYACRNNSGNFPSDPRKQEVTGPVIVAAAFTSDRNGQITGRLTLIAPRADPPLECPGTQILALVSASYTNGQATEEASGASTIYPNSAFQIHFGGGELS